MSFIEPKDFVVGEQYKLTEFVENQLVSSGYYYLHSIEPIPKSLNPALGFVKNGLVEKSDVCLVEAHAQFGGPCWRRAFKVDGQWELYWPAGGRTWGWSCVVVEKIPKTEE
ncbi:MAG: hypothetical protein A3J55_01050 [Candidatus Ryanbacteria bacterium RIFCSPHIGHO2_02_FULL_45_17b]|uniref:Uncharacterized protein n=1 Tax=Candidatus Ryanbacteria bacterium RIFCSPHIGHO2_01_FULL_45_22 TaxID=1802114 RepID=A0A1G2G1Y1_9BACT|nr:MAG: hypothetical protein A2719_03520 [Candidatus Ryanbacteria bacterium RIFCSPHIGHO2_01_FULL_45_22]OGZ47124.1 MAG: hypothetical protein A3J55_01050 [Candidatus Ryanbacteria bacterium RIFCSPHIGHO2_02_FULL_45_17b]